MRSLFKRIWHSLKPESSEGFLFVCTGDRHCKETREAIQSIIDAYLNKPLISVCTNKPDLFKDLDLDQLIIHPDVRQSYRDKIVGLQKLPYSRTLFLDSDTWLARPVDEIFSLLHHLDIAAAYAPVRWAQWKDRNVPTCLPEVNSGVIGLRRSRKTRNLLRDWLSHYDSIGVAYDQATLRSILWKHISAKGLKHHILPSEYNLRTTKPWIAGQNASVSIIHGRLSQQTRLVLSSYLNSRSDAFRSSSCFPTNLNANPVQPQETSKKHIFVLGAGRSGTSLVAGLFRCGGFYQGREPYKTRDANPTGFYEDREVNEINEAILALASGVDPTRCHGWLSQLPESVPLTATPELASRIKAILRQSPTLLKDPRFSYTLDAWRSLIGEQGLDECKYICVFRDPGTMIASVQKELVTASYLDSITMDARAIEAVWISQYRYILSNLATDGDWLFVNYDQVVDGSKLTALEVFIGSECDESIIRPNLRRSKPVDISLTSEAQDLYEQLCQKSQ